MEGELACYKAENERLAAEATDTQKIIGDLRKQLAQECHQERPPATCDRLKDEPVSRVQALERELENVEQRVEVRHYCVLEEERRNWEPRQEWLVVQLRESEQHRRAARKSQGGTREQAPAAGGASPGREYVQQSLTLQLSGALLAQQLPPISPFNGEDGSLDRESFKDWIEQFEMVAELAGWCTQARLLRGQAYAFFRSCTPAQRVSYSSLVWSDDCEVNPSGDKSGPKQLLPRP